MLFRNNSCRLFILIAALILITAHGLLASQPDSVAHNRMETLVTTEWLSQHLDDSNIVILDCTVIMKPKEGGGLQAMSGRPQYEGGHIPTAGFADLLVDLNNSESSLKFAMPASEQFCAAMGALGVGNNSLVVLYDGFNSVWAARVWWMLRWIGFDRAAILDGGLKAWSAEERPLSTEPANHKTKQLTANLRPNLIANRDEVFSAINNDSVSLIDAMHEAHFFGKMILYDRPGHVPSAINIPATALLDESGRYLAQDKLASMFDIDHKARVITYCGAGIAASSNAFILHRLGYSDVAVYMASLQEWAADPDNPLVVDEH